MKGDTGEKKRVLSGATPPSPLDDPHYLLFREKLTIELQDALPAEFRTADSVEPVEYALKTTGKLLRPYLTYLAFESVGGAGNKIWPVLAGVELGHIASLVHDDIIDRSSLRRGVPAVSAKFGVDRALLAGDMLVFLSFFHVSRGRERGLSDTEVTSCVRELSRTYLELWAGQNLEARFVRNLELDERCYLEMVEKKTASFFVGAMRLGGIIGRASGEKLAVLEKYGRNLGIAFQIRDDLLGFVSQSVAMTKPAENDIAVGRVTLPLIYAMLSGGTLIRDKIAAVLSGSNAIEGRAFLAGHLRETGAIERAWETAKGYTQSAVVDLQGLPPSPARDRLARLAAYLVDTTQGDQEAGEPPGSSTCSVMAPWPR